MNIVCFSYLSPPAGDAESACTGRFLSALANDGHHVHLVTFDHPRCLDEAIEREILSPKIKVTRLPLKEKLSVVKKVVSRLKHGFFGIGVEYIEEACNALSQVLTQYSDPILISRAAFPVSNVVGWYCRKQAKRWIAHFSDPYPTYARTDLSYWLKKNFWRYPFDYLWCYRVLRNADQITVTASRAIRYFNTITGYRFRAKLHVLYHIGSPRLMSSGYVVERPNDHVRIVAHVGHLMAGRHPEYIVRSFNQSPCDVVFYQYGRVDASLPGHERVRAFSVRDPRMATDAMASADAVLVSDLQSNFGYCPYLTSKFAYAVALNVPIICVSDAESEVADLAKKYKGVYFADYKDEFGLMRILSMLDARQLVVPESQLAKLFTSESVLRDFYRIANFGTH